MSRKFFKFIQLLEILLIKRSLIKATIEKVVEKLLKIFRLLKNKVTQILNDSFNRKKCETRDEHEI